MKYAILSSLLLLIIELQSQTYSSVASQYCQHNYSATARSAGVAGAFGSVGADLSAASGNPAGLGLFRTSEAHISLGFDQQSSRTDLLGASQSGSRFGMDIRNLAAIYTKTNEVDPDEEFKRWTSYSLAISYSRQESFKRNYRFDALNSENSITDAYVAELNEQAGVNPAYDGSLPFEAVNAYFAWLANGSDSTGLNDFKSPVPDIKRQYGSISNSGSYRELNIALAGSRMNKLYWGISVCFPGIEYRQHTIYREQDEQALNPYFNELIQENDYTINGWGVQAKGGIIYKPSPYFRFGAALHSPAAFNMSEVYNTEITHDLDSAVIADYTVNGDYFQQAPSTNFNYRLRLPWRASASASVYFNKYGFFSVDYEMIDYDNLRYRFGTLYEDYEAEVNNGMKQQYRVSHQIRAGAEAALENWRIRAGYAYSFSPFAPAVAVRGYDQHHSQICFGGGYRKDKFYFDLACQLSESSSYYSLYYPVDGSTEPGLRKKDRGVHFVLSGGWKF